MTRRRARTLGAGLAVAGILLVAAAGQVSGVLALETHRGVGEPAWSPDGGHVHWFERETRVFVVGRGREHFTAPARVRVLDDRLTLLRRAWPDGAVEVLHRLEMTPHVDRWTRRYRSRIAGAPRARLDAEGRRVVASLSIPRVPKSELWRYEADLGATGSGAAGPGAAGSSAADTATAGRWRTGRPAAPRDDAERLAGGLELLVEPGAEGFGRAVLAQNPAGALAIVAAVDGFELATVDARRLAERSRRGDIERISRLRAERERLEAAFRARGLDEGAAALAAIDALQEAGLLRPGATIAATPVDAAPAGTPVFEIPGRYLDVGLFRDLAAAAAAPGEPVDTSTGDYLVHAGDDVGRRLRRHREAHDRFFVRIDGRLWRFDVARPDRTPPD